jgi:multiple sugar transport system permease protein
LLIKAKSQWKPLHLFAHIVLLGGAFVLFYPLLYMFLIGLFSKLEYNTAVIGFFPIPKDPVFHNVKQLLFGFGDSKLRSLYMNSLFRTGYATLTATVTSLLAGYVFARLKFKGKELLFIMLLGLQTIPTIVAIIPTYLELARFPFAYGNHIFTGGKGILDTPWVYILLNGPGIYILGAFLVKQALEQIPTELDEAGKMDGAGVSTLIFRILMPMLKPVLAFIAIKVSLDTWNDWQMPFFYTNSSGLQTLASNLVKVALGTPGVSLDVPYIITLSLMVTIPSLIVFFLFQKLIVQGLANVGIKG